VDVQPISDISLQKNDKIVLGLLVGAGGAVAVALLYGLYVLMPFLVELAQDTVMFVGLMLVAGCLGLLALQLYLTRDAIMHQLKLNARKLSRRVWTRDPIGTIDIAIKRLQVHFDEAKQRQTEATAATMVLEKRIRNPNDRRNPGVLDQAELEEQLAQQAELQRLPKEDVDLHLIAAQRWRESAETLGTLLVHQKERQAKVEEARKLAERGLTDLNNQKKVMSIQLDALRAEAAQAKSFRKFFGRSPELEMIDVAVEEIDRASAQAEAEIEQLLRDADPLLQREKLQREADAAAARARLAARRPAAALPAETVATPLPSLDRKVVGISSRTPDNGGKK
jgi:hypothetical protein